jgi:hypothetical protein
MNQPEKSEALLREAVAIRRKLLGPEDPRTLVATTNLAATLAGRNRLSEAEPLLREVLAVQRRKLGILNSDTLHTLMTLAGLLQDQRKLLEAQPVYAELVEASREVSGPRHTDTLIALNDYALLLMELDRLPEAEAFAREAVEGGVAALPRGHPFTASFRRTRGRILTRQKRWVDAERELLQSHADLSRSEGELFRQQAANVAKRLVELYEAWGRPERASAWRRP